MKNPASNTPPDAKDPAGKPGAPAADVKHLYDRHDPIPVPDATESDTESVWALFNEGDAKKKKPPADDGFGATEPAPLEMPKTDFDAATEMSPLLSDFDIPTRHSPLPGGSGFDDTTRAADLHPDFDAPTQAAPLGQRRKPGP